LTLPWLVCVRDGLRLYTPLSGAIVRRGALARFCKTAAAMYQAGVPVAEAMEAAALAMGNCLLARRALAQIPPLRDGGSVADAVAASRLFEPTFAGMIATGEQSGTLPETLYQVAREYEQRRDSGRRVLVIGSIGIGLLLGAAIIGAVVVKFYTTYYGSMMREMLDAVE
ncbi:MAG: type II secretion system F family protein, partial [Armatimonadota bacterium]